MTDFEHVAIERVDDALAIARLKGDGRFNLMSHDLLRDLWRTANQLQEDPAIRVVIVTGAPGVFSAGMNLKRPEIRDYRAQSVEERLAVQALGARACAAWEGLDAVTIAAVEGPCMGGGIAFAVSCDFRIGASDTTWWVPELLNGMNMSWQSIPRFVSLVGPARARALVMRAKQVDTATAVDWGLADEACEPSHALEAAQAMARALLAIPGVPMRMSKHAINAAANALNHVASHMDRDQYVLCQSTDDHATALDAFYAKRRP